MSKQYCLLFAGQGAQFVGMGRELAEQFAEAREVFERADAVLERKLSTICFDGPEGELTKTSNCQPGIFTHSMAALALLRKNKPDLAIAACAGLSLGEFTAHTAAGTFSFEDGLRLVGQRGRFMQQACEATKGAMASLIGADEETATQIAQEADVDVANFNSPGQIVLSGEADKIAAAIEIAKVKGVKKAIPLTVAGAYHSRLMRSAQEQLGAVLAAMTIGKPLQPVVANVTAQFALEPGEIRHTLTEQVCGSVRWDQSMRYLIGKGHTEFIELGPGNVLSGLMRRINKEAVVHTVSDPKTLEETLSKL
ncbi:ACP S-malonyltransferase [Oscillatoria laete-virens NRMC-F 0139]|nr:ACP S-malonyltransferase [Oscillatoria laete-virens]MDL5053651.1 ACP S-malonyltransferase [Oscillatoria laete-virens NRMC-F 0139]